MQTMHHESTRQDFPLRVGTPCIWGDMANPDKTGWIAEIGEESASFAITGNGMQRAGANLTIVWEDNTLSTVSTAIAQSWIDRAEAFNLAVINDAPERLQEAQAAQRIARDKVQQDRDRAAQERTFWDDAHRDKVPTWAKSVLIGEYERDDCDSMTDYFNTVTERSIVLAFSSHSRDLFSEMRKAARNHPDTAPLADAPKDAEHREKYSMGAGYYLSEGGRYRTGWRVRKISLYDADPIRSVPMGDWCVPDDAKPSPKTTAKRANVAAGGVTIEQHTHTKKGFDMWIVCLADRVERDAYQAMLADAKALGGWYSRKWGNTPAGFAFKDQAKAEKFAAGLGGGDDKPTDSAPVPNRAEKLRTLAAGMQAAIDQKNAPRRTNTPKQQREADQARHDAKHLERAQAGLQALADLHDAGNVPPELTDLMTKKAALSLAESDIDRTNAGYYDAGIDTGEPYHSSPDALAFWALLKPRSAEDVRADELQRKLTEVKRSSIAGYFPTPATIVERMLDHAGDMDGLRVLEPEAGSGAILDGIKAHSPDAELTACEVAPRLQEILKLKGYQVSASDFNDFTPDQLFDRVIMNPPFEKGQDMDHVRHAFDMLKPGGRLVAIMSPGYSFRSDKRAVAFRDWLAGLVWEFEELPSNAFKESGTGVQTHMLIIEADA